MKPIPTGMDKTWQCPECVRRFARETDLRRHIRNTHYVVRRPEQHDGGDAPEQVQ